MSEFWCEAYNIHY